jgi:hypothetical protein
MASLVAALATNFLLYYLTGERLDYWDANVFLAALVAGVLALVVVSLLTPPEPIGSIDSFFGRLQTSTDETARSDEPSPLLLVNLFTLRRGAGGRGWRAFREDLGGFAFGWVLVILLVAATALFLTM